MIEAHAPLILRVLSVLAGCIAGLLAGGMLYYVFLEDNIAVSGDDNSRRSGRVLKVCAVISFLVAVWILEMRVFPAMIVSFVSLALCRLMWAIGDGMMEAGAMYEALVALKSDDSRLRDFLDRVTKYRQVQDLRRVARKLYVHGSQYLKRMEQIIAEKFEDRFANEEENIRS